MATTARPEAPRWPASASALVLANAFQLGGVLALGWSLYALVLLYWCENVVVGFFNILRMLYARPPDSRAWIGKVLLPPVFVVKYGGFTLVHGMAVVAVFGDGWSSGVGATREPGFSLALLLLGLSHGFSFFRNYVAGGECRRVYPGQLMTQPYQRLIVLHIVIFAGAYGLQAFAAPAPMLVLLVLAKTLFDLRAHLVERRKFAEEPPQPTPTTYVSPRIRGGVIEEGSVRPIAGASVLAFWRYESRLLVCRIIEATSGPDGAFAIGGWTYRLREPVSGESPTLVHFAPGCGLSVVERPGSGGEELVLTLRAVRSQNDAQQRAGELEQAARTVAEIAGLLEVAPPPLRILDAIEAEWRALPADARGERPSPAALYERVLAQIRASLVRRIFE